MSIRLNLQRLLSGKKAPPIAERMPKPPPVKSATIADLRTIGRPWPPEPIAEEKPEVKTRGRALGLAFVFTGLLVIAFAFLFSDGYRNVPGTEAHVDMFNPDAKSPLIQGTPRPAGILESLPYLYIEAGNDKLRLGTRWVLLLGIALCLLGAYVHFAVNKQKTE